MTATIVLVNTCAICHHYGLKKCEINLMQVEACFAMSEGFPWHYTTEPERWFDD